MLIKAALLAIVVLFWGALLALGVGAAWQALRCVVSDVRTWTQWRRSRTWSQTSGTVTRSWVKVERGRRYTTFTPEIAYSYEVGERRRVGTRHQFVSRLASWSRDDATAAVARWPRAANVHVWFDAANPGAASLDRSRPPLLWPLVLVVLLAFVAALFTAVGVYGFAGIEALPFTDHELPPLAQQFGGLFVMVGGLGVVVATFVLRRARQNAGRVARLETAVPVRCADAKPGQEVAVFGVAEPRAAGGETGEGGDEPDASPIADLPAVWGRLVVHFADRSTREAVIERGFWVRDASGRLFVPAEVRIEFIERCAAIDPARLQDWLATVFTGDVMPAIETIDARMIAPGDPVLVVGRVARTTSRVALAARTGEPQLAVPARADAAVLAAHSPLAAVRARLCATRWRTLRSAAALLLFAGLVLLFG